MKIRTLILASAAAAALGCTGGGAFAQDNQTQNTQDTAQYSSHEYASQQTETTQTTGTPDTQQDRGSPENTWPDYPQNYYHTNPTPEERAQTNALNKKQAQDEGTAQDGRTGRAADAQYRAEQQRYQEQRQDYEDQRENYRHRLAEYEYDRSHPHSWWRAHYYRASVYAFYRLPTHDLIGKEVDERDGLDVGRISDVERYGDGRVARIEVALHNDRIAWIDAPDLRYDADDRVMFTDVPADTLYDRSHDGYYNPRP